MTERKFKEIKTNAWQYSTEGDSIEGEFLRIEAGGQYGNNYILKVKDEEVVVFGLTALHSKMAKAKIGQYIKVTYLGEVKSKSSKQIYKDFKVEVAE